MIHRVLLSVVLWVALLSPLAVCFAAQTLSNGFTAADTSVRTGLWWNPQRPGHGLDIHFSGEQLFVIWYTFDDNGQSIWYTGQGKQTGNRWEFALLKHRWSNASGRSTGSVNIGQMSLRFSTASTADFSWKIGNANGNESLEPFQLAGVGAADDHTGAWYVATEPGYGLTVNHQGSYEMLVFYFYDTEGNPRWVLGNNGGHLGTKIKVDSYQSACPTCPDLQVTLTAAGEIQTSFRSETEARLDLLIELDSPIKLAWKLADKPIVLLSNLPSGRVHAAALARFASPQALEQFIEAGLKERLAVNATGSADGLTVSAAPSHESSGRSFSTTNLQEQGVDEADRLKTDGTYMYVASQSGDQVRVLKMFTNPYKAEEKAAIEFAGNPPILKGLYLVNQRQANRPDLLISVHGGETTGRFAPEVIWDTPFPWINGNTELRFFNLRVPEQPTEMTRLKIEGVLLASRRIGESLYVVTRFSPDLSFQSNGGRIPAQAQQIDALLATTDLSDLLPQVQLGSASSTALIGSGQTYLPPITDGFRSTDLISVSKIDLTNPQKKPDSVAMVGYADTVYVSTEALYIATSRYAYNPIFSARPTIGIPPQPAFETPSTDIHKFSLTASQLEYRGSARIEGYLSGDGQARPFRLSEHEQVLRVVSSGQWGKLGDNRVTLIKESDTQASDLLVELSHLPNASRPQPLGKPGEQLHATRFVDERLFMVTFKKIDPLISVDLSNTRDPVLQGELEIPGYSDYLHPLSEHLLLGVGKDAVDAQGGVGDGQFAWYQGIRIGLFDVSGRRATELDHILIGQRGSQSELLTDHHAFSLLPPQAFSGNPTRFTIPISVTGKEFPQGSPAVLNRVQSWTKTGLYLFEVDINSISPGLKNSGALVVTDLASSGLPGFADMASGANRSLLIEDGIFYSHQGRVWSAAWQSPNLLAGPR